MKDKCFAEFPEHFMGFRRHSTTVDGHPINVGKYSAGFEKHRKAVGSIRRKQKSVTQFISRRLAVSSILIKNARIVNEGEIFSYLT